MNNIENEVENKTLNINEQATNLVWYVLHANSQTEAVEHVENYLTSQRQTLRDEIGKMKKDVNLDDDSADFFHITGYNTAIADVLALLDNK